MRHIVDGSRTGAWGIEKGGQVALAALGFAPPDWGASITVNLRPCVSNGMVGWREPRRHQSSIYGFEKAFSD